MRRLLAAAGAVSAALLAVAAVVAPWPAEAASRICDPFATVLADGYLVQNNRWGATSAQCLGLATTEVAGAGFDLTTSDAALPTDGAPAGYPSVVWGCHYGRCTDGFSPLPLDGAPFARLRTSVALTRVDGGDWDAAYDLWFDPTARRDGHDEGAELMIWFDRAGRPRPSGRHVGDAVVEGQPYDVYVANGRSRTVTYCSRTPNPRPSFAVRSFADDATARGLLRRSWYLTSIQAGIEPWRGGAGLALRGFTVST